MVKKVLPLFFIIFVWFIFASPFILDHKIPFPTDLQLNNFSLWSSYPEFWGPIRNPAQPDVISQIIPWKKLTIDSILNFQIPFWNPYSFSGTPHLANYQSGSFSITNIFFFIFDFKTAWALAVLIQPLLAGIFTYFFVRSLNKTRMASVLSAISFMFCGFITTWMSYTTMSLAISFLPLALFATEKYFQSNKLGFLVLLSFSFPLSFFSGHFQISLYFALFVFLYISFKFYETKDKSGFITTFLFSFLGFLLCMPQIIPSIELYLSAPRSDLFQKIEAVPLKYLPTIIAPDFYGNPVTRNNLFSSYAEWSAFLGVIPFLLGLYSLSIKSKKVIFFFIMAFIALLFSINSPILDYLVQLKIPVISTSSASRILALFSFSFSILAAFGLDELRNDLIKSERRKISIWIVFYLSIFLVIFILIFGNLMGAVNYHLQLRNMIFPSFIFLGFIFSIILAVASKRMMFLSMVFIVLLVSFDMLRFTKKWQTFSSFEKTFISTPIITKLQNLGNLYRTVGAFGAEGSVYFQIPGAEGYDPLYIGRYGEFTKSLNDGNLKNPDSKGLALPTNAKFMPKIIDLLGIKYVLLKKSDEKKSWTFPFKKYPNKFKMIYRDKEFSIFENKDVYPRAFLVGNYFVSNNNQEIIDKVLDENFDLRKNVVLEKDPKINRAGDIEGETVIINYKPNQVILETNSSNNSILVISDNYYPGWRAKVNGQDKEIIRANYTFRAVPVPKGKSKVEFYFDSESFKRGFYLAIVSLISIFIIIAGKWYTNSKFVETKKTAESVSKLPAGTAKKKRVGRKI